MHPSMIIPAFKARAAAAVAALRSDLERVADPPAIPPASQGTQTLMSDTNTGGSAIVSKYLPQIEQVGEEILADIEAKAEPIAEAIVNDLLAKLPFGEVLEPLADAVLRQVAAKLATKLTPATA